MKKRVFLMSVLFLLIFSKCIFSQSLIQIGFIVKKALPSIQKIALIDLVENETVITKQAKSAQLIAKIQFTLYTIKNSSGIGKAIKKISKLKNTVVFLKTNNNLFTEKTVNFIAMQLYAKKIPVVTDRESDTMKGAILTFSKNAQNKFESHISKLVSSYCGLTFNEEFLKTAIVDVE